MRHARAIRTSGYKVGVFDSTPRGPGFVFRDSTRRGLSRPGESRGLDIWSLLYVTTAKRYERAEAPLRAGKYRSAEDGRVSVSYTSAGLFVSMESEGLLDATKLHPRTRACKLIPLEFWQTMVASRSQLSLYKLIVPDSSSFYESRMSQTPECSEEVTRKLTHIARLCRVSLPERADSSRHLQGSPSGSAEHTEEKFREDLLDGEPSRLFTMPFSQAYIVPDMR